MDQCPKCNSCDISGPRFHVNGYGHESLRYECTRCGYADYTPCADAKPLVVTRFLDGTLDLPKSAEN